MPEISFDALPKHIVGPLLAHGPIAEGWNPAAFSIMRNTDGVRELAPVGGWRSGPFGLYPTEVTIPADEAQRAFDVPSSIEMQLFSLVHIQTGITIYLFVEPGCAINAAEMILSVPGADWANYVEDQNSPPREVVTRMTAILSADGYRKLGNEGVLSRTLLHTCEGSRGNA